MQPRSVTHSGIVTPFCDGCGNQVHANQNFCIKCGRPLQPIVPPQINTHLPTQPRNQLPELGQPHQSAPTQTWAPALVPPRPRSQMRPMGVSVIAVLIMILGGLDIGVMILSLTLATISIPTLKVTIILRFGGILDVLFYIALILSGIASFVLAYGLWNGRVWAWKWTLISSIASLIASATAISFQIGTIGIVIYPIIILYLTRHRAKSYFGK